MGKYFIGITGIILFVFLFQSCKKLEYDHGITSFGEVYFNLSNVATFSTLEVRYNGSPIELQTGTGRIRVPEGEGKFDFYNKATGNILLEKNVNIIAESPERYTLFQPTVEAPLTFLDENELEDEEAAPEGFYKVKIANYANHVLTFENIDIIVLGSKFDWVTFEEIFVELVVLENIGQNLEEENFHLIPKPTGDVLGIAFAYRDSKNKEDVLNKLGERFITGFNPSNSFPDAEKDVYKGYLNARLIDYESDYFVEKDGKLYSLDPVLFLGR